MVIQSSEVVVGDTLNYGSERLTVVAITKRTAKQVVWTMSDGSSWTRRAVMLTPVTR